MWRTCAIILLLTTSSLYAQEVTGDLNTAVGDGSTVDSNNTTNSTNITNNRQGAMSNPVPSAIAPTVMGAGGNDTCLIPKSQGMQISLFGISKGEAEQDPECNRRKDARLLGTPQAVGGLGLQVSGISIMCNNPQVFRAMALANTPCPIMDVDTGRLLIGREAFEKYRSNPSVFIVGYAQDRKFWNNLLAIGRKLKDVETNDDKPSLSERFRRNSRSARSDIQRSGDSSQPDNGQGE